MLWQQFLWEQLFGEQENEAVAEFASDTMSCWLNPMFGHHGWPPSKQEPIKFHFAEHDQQAALDFLVGTKPVSQHRHASH